MKSYTGGRALRPIPIRKRARVARFLNASSTEEIAFTYGATSSINLLAYAWGASLQAGDEILLSTLEHHSNLVPWQELAKRHGVVLRFLPMTDDGRLNLDRLETELTDRCRLVAFTHCSNVTGALTDVARVVAAARAVGAKIMLDGAQRAPQGPLDVRKLDVDFYVFSGHKTYGPTGIGVLWGRRELLDAMPPFMTGGQMIEAVTLTSSSFRAPPRRFEAGTPPIAQAIGLGATLDWMQGLDWDAIQAHEERLTRRLIDGLTSLAGVRLLGPVDTRDRRVSSRSQSMDSPRTMSVDFSMTEGLRCVAVIIAPSRWCVHSGSRAPHVRALRRTVSTPTWMACFKGSRTCCGADIKEPLIAMRSRCEQVERQRCPVFARR
jgi:selenocysteine lyase/cysteine desulfurase